MSWQAFFVAPMSQALFAWHYSGSISFDSLIGRSTSSYFLFKIASFTLDEPERTYGNGVTVLRDWFNVYYALAEFDSYNFPSTTPVMGESVYYNPKSTEDHGFEVLTELYLPYKPKPGQEDKGRFLGVKKLPRKGGQKVFAKITGYGNPWQFGELQGSISRRQNDDDKLLLQIYHWVESDITPTLIYTGIEALVYEQLTLTPKRFSDILAAFPESDHDAVALALEELERKGSANRVAGRKGEYWSLAMPY